MTLSCQGRPRPDYLDDVLPGFELRISTAGVRTFAVRLPTTDASVFAQELRSPGTTEGGP
jgi:hypothetical protein